jgi:molybdopterin/thiamine biosynthesis adenylyltransferase
VLALARSIYLINLPERMEEPGMRTLKQRLTRLTVAIALAAGLAFAAAPTLSAQGGDDLNMVCVYYTETFGVCMGQTVWPNGSITTKMYWFWGDSYGLIY